RYAAQHSKARVVSLFGDLFSLWNRYYDIDPMLSQLVVGDFANSLLQHFHRGRVYRGPFHFKSEARLCHPADSLAAINEDLTRIIAERNSRAYFRAVRRVRVVSSVLYCGACSLSAVNFCPCDPQYCGPAFWQQYCHLLDGLFNKSIKSDLCSSSCGGACRVARPQGTSALFFLYLRWQFLFLFC